MKKQRILVLLSVVALMVVMLAFFIATAAIAQGEQGRGTACGKIMSASTPAFGKVLVPLGCTT
jgi:hypothetical protein